MQGPISDGILPPTDLEKLAYHCCHSLEAVIIHGPVIILCQLLAAHFSTSAKSASARLCRRRLYGRKMGGGQWSGYALPVKLESERRKHRNHGATPSMGLNLQYYV